ncbi:MAG: carboxypeptidase-like regulatory domain-containing protein [Candidatus Brocadiaceae bacterium]|nr:carboxypeptidase-like regulatory domain-containing protein [Candidatus Brocadiaceae bacterium]
MAGWQIETVDTGPVSESTSLAFDASGKPAISYVGPDNLKYAHFNGSLWDITTVDEGAMDDMCCTSLAFHPLSGKPAISYYDLGDSVLKYASFNGAAWVITPVDSIDSASIREEDGATSLAFDTSGRPAIAYSDDGDVHNGILKYAHFNGATWDITSIDPGGCVGESVSLAFDPVSGNPSISYIADCEGIGSDTDHLKYAHFNGTAWDITTVDSRGDGSMDESSSLAFDSSGNPAIAYARGISEDDSNIKYAHFNGATWDITTVDSKGSVGGESSLAFDSSGNPAIAYEEEISCVEINEEEICDVNIKYAHFNGTTWDITTIDAGSGPSLAFDADGRPAIAYSDLGNYDLKFARFVPCQCDAGSPMGCISGTVTKVGTGKPLAGKTVTLRRMSPKPRITLNATTGSDGCYSFIDLVNGTYKIKVSSCKGGGSKTKKITGGGKVNNVNFRCR